MLLNVAHLSGTQSVGECVKMLVLRFVNVFCCKITRRIYRNEVSESKAFVYFYGQKQNLFIH